MSACKLVAKLRIAREFLRWGKDESEEWKGFVLDLSTGDARGDSLEDTDGERAREGESIGEDGDSDGDDCGDLGVCNPVPFTWRNFQAFLNVSEHTERTQSFKRVAIFMPDDEGKGGSG